MRINDNQVTTRHERPTVLGPTALILYFVNDGQYTDPESISGVSIFAASDNQSPSSVITSDGEIDTAVTGSILMHFSPSANANTTSIDFNPSNYNVTNASGIYKLDTGKYAVVLNSSGSTPSGVFNLSGDTTILNEVSSTGDYIDVWTVQVLI